MKNRAAITQNKKMNRLTTYTVSAGPKLLLTYRFNYQERSWEKTIHSTDEATTIFADEPVMARSLEMFRAERCFVIEETLCAWCLPREVRDKMAGLNCSHGICRKCQSEVLADAEGFLQLSD